MPQAKSKNIFIDGDSLYLSTVIAVSQGKPSVKLSPKARKKVAASHRHVNNLVESTSPIYGINTGFGLLSDVRIPKNKLKELQVNLLRSHACGVGDPLSKEIVRAALLLRANTLAKGHSGCSPELIDAILALLNNDIIPWVPEQGSVGACGDLAPLAHLSLVLIGEGEAYIRNKLVSGKKALRSAGLSPYELKPKEGLCLINGTQIMTAIGSFVIHHALNLVSIADIAGAMSLEAFRGTNQSYHPAVHGVRAHKGQIKVAKNLLQLTKNSAIAKSHLECGRIQDPYSFRCMPQVHGISREYVDQSKQTLETECNSATDNPLIFLPDGKKTVGLRNNGVISGGNFHGQYMAMTMDVVAIALSELANIADQRMQKLINPTMSQLPAFLTPDPGLHSGMMIVQVASASLVSENKSLAHPASVDSISTSADKEDHVSMGVTAARKALKIVQNLQNTLAMELLCASQGLEFLKPLKAGTGVNAAYKEIRKVVRPIKKDRPFHKDIEAIAKIIEDGSLLRCVEKAIKFSLLGGR